MDKDGVADDPICMGKKWQRVVGGVVDQAVDNTWNIILKRHDCYYQYGVGEYRNECPGVFETSYNRTEIGCKGGSDGDGVDLFASHSCVPQQEARTLIEEKGKMYTDVLAKYYTPLSLYERKDTDFKVNSTVETLSNCMLILYDLDGLSQYKCLKSNKDDSKIDKVYFQRTDRNRLVCQEGSTNCPLGQHYVVAGIKGILLEMQINKDGELWFKVQWKVKPGSNASDNQTESKNVIVGWSPDTDIKPADAMSLVEVKIIGARLKVRV